MTTSEKTEEPCLVEGDSELDGIPDAVERAAAIWKGRKKTKKPKDDASQPWFPAATTKEAIQLRDRENAYKTDAAAWLRFCTAGSAFVCFWRKWTTSVAKVDYLYICGFA